MRRQIRLNPPSQGIRYSLAALLGNRDEAVIVRIARSGFFHAPIVTPRTTQIADTRSSPLGERDFAARRAA